MLVQLLQLLHPPGMRDWPHSLLMEDLQHHMIIASHSLPRQSRYDHAFDTHIYANVYHCTRCMTYSVFAHGMCRATYAAEQSVQKLEKGKKDQDLLIDHLQQQLRSQEQQIAIYSQQYDAQKRETRAAKEMLAGAEAEMEGIHFEKKQLTAQWQSSLIATQRRDQALRVSMGNAGLPVGGCRFAWEYA